MVDSSASGASELRELVSRVGEPETITGWKALADGLLVNRACAFHRNMEISARYAWMYGLLPACFKWVGLAAFASHHVRLALVPLWLDTDRSGYVNIPRSLGRQRLLLMEDVNTIRETNNAIFNDIFWVHLAYVSGDDGIGRVRALLQADSYYGSVIAGFEAIEQGRRVLEGRSASTLDRQAAEDLIWAGNVQLLEHEQRALVQPHFDRLSCAFARLVSLGSATSFEVRGARQEAGYFTSFYLDSLTRGLPRVLQSRGWPRITRFDDRWWWILASVVPRFRRFGADQKLIDTSLHRILDAARDHAATPCRIPHLSTESESPPNAWQWRPKSSAGPRANLTYRRHGH